MKTRVFKDAIYEQIARIGKSLGSGPRLEILDLLCQGPRTVEVLAGQMGHSVANTSRHLQVLRRARLIEAEREGVYIRYRLADPEVCAFFLSLRKLAESRLLEVEEITRVFLEARNTMEPVDRNLLVERVRSGKVTVLDVRPTEEYLAGHIPGAVSIPLDQLEERLAELPTDREIVAYCRGPYCVMALDAADTLRSNGLEATRFEDGIADWRARGLDVAVGEE
ncbi:MAG: ArsR family transcriptional regulator [Deltaproteobacteria bacterium]|jgi:rhodanese-related sulfurtransferase|nr:metalloregulator ArsR/SmtB family transcription factor [Deltaproteobacteria bacterium]MBW2188339.1 metalloregulator ArsR/SmtB family transcription factor [Deltaproteobacteria bacterium]MBW2224378.1 metalloregulator ArsR/SmtB family transcription factor [Deltaproteobacteria bacterium]MBW2717482.1 metalloregulator ArsR/SmtB family transcription factor [Deltaproteobacteria bacterium]RLB48882.1 MAG: ArsR family transcriptional regulator [Deltaproteobacteria bacterium]